MMLVHTASGRELLMAWARTIMSFGFINKVCCIIQFLSQSLCTCAVLSEKVPAPFLMSSIYFGSADLSTCLFFQLFDSLHPWSFHCFSFCSLLPLLPAKMGDIFSKDSPRAINFKTMGSVTIFPRFCLGEKKDHPNWFEQLYRVLSSSSRYWGRMIKSIWKATFDSIICWVIMETCSSPVIYHKTCS